MSYTPFTSPASAQRLSGSGRVVSEGSCLEVVQGLKEIELVLQGDICRHFGRIFLGFGYLQLTWFIGSANFLVEEEFALKEGSRGWLEVAQTLFGFLWVWWVEDEVNFAEFFEHFRGVKHLFHSSESSRIHWANARVGEDTNPNTWATFLSPGIYFACCGKLRCTCPNLLYPHFIRLIKCLNISSCELPVYWYFCLRFNFWLHVWDFMAVIT